MEKKYLLVSIDDIKKGAKPNPEDTEIVYVVDSPFKKYLFEEAIKRGKTEILDREEFDWNVEIYKLLKQSVYLGYDKIKISILSGWSGEFTQEEAKMVCEVYEEKVVDLDNLIKEIHEKIEEGNKEPKIVVYTCITGGYDGLIEPTVITPGVDYICFTDDATLKSKNWKIRPLPEEIAGLSKVKQQRAVKMLPHKYLSDYSVSVYVDGSVVIRGNIKEFLSTLDLNTYSVFISEHPQRKCIYAEKKACIAVRKLTKPEDIKIAEEQMQRYKKEGFPENFGLVQANIIVRRHNDEYCKQLMEAWWAEFKENAPRDQLSFNYVLWKTGNKKFKYLPKTTCNSKTFNWLKAHKKK